MIDPPPFPGCVAFDGAVIADGPPTGVTSAFLATLRAYAGRARRVLLLVPSRALGAARASVGSALADLLVPSDDLTLLGRAVRLPRALRRLGVDVWHSPVAALPPRAHCPMVATVHDVPWLVPALRTEVGSRLRHRVALRIAASAAAALVTPSQRSADDIVRALGRAPRAPVHVVPHGLPLPSSPAPLADLRGPLVAFGDARPRKNLARLRAAHAQATGVCADLPPLRIVGPGLDWVDDDAKVALLRTATALVAPSLHEGFGLPVLEAFGHGVPVACSRTGALAELAGDAACTFDPESVDDLAGAIVRVATDIGLRERLRHRGRVRAAALTPDRTATAWLRLHHSLTEVRR
ncbi:MAG: glycosyltransferase family 4 protein [Planctomycetes bacterium]|nr:glycosyltransferase family 4 protein [Planctomycetota bacterium]